MDPGGGCCWPPAPPPPPPPAPANPAIGLCPMTRANKSCGFY